MVQELEKVAQLTREEAKKLLTEEILDETRRDVAVQVRTMEQQAKDEADLNAKKSFRLRFRNVRQIRLRNSPFRLSRFPTTT